MMYSFLNQDDERLIELSEMPLDEGIAVAMRTTGYELARDEILELAITDLDGRELFHKLVKPQNIEEWQPSTASGGIAAADVEEAPELFQFEDEVRELFEKASIVVFEHEAFALALIESSWIALPACRTFDLDEEFRLSHCAPEYPKEPAAAVALSNIVEYYEGVAEGQLGGATGLVAEAATIAACYKALVAEHAQKREAKGDEYWQARERRLAEQAAQDAGKDAVAQLREKRLNQMNGLLWIAGAIIFASLVIQLYQRGGDMGFMLVAGAASAFCAIRGIINLRG